MELESCSSFPDPGDPVTELVTTDEETGTQQYAYSLLDDAGGLFHLENNTLRTNTVYDYETQRDLQWQITLKSTDSGTPPLSVSFVI